MVLIIVMTLFFSLSVPSLAAVEPLYDLNETQNIIAENPLRFSDMGWSHDEDDFFEYVPNEGVFKRGTRVYAYMEVVGFTSQMVDEYNKIDLSVDVYLKTSFGLRLFRQLDVIEFDDMTKEPQDRIWFYLYVDIPWWAPRGTYIAEVVVRDRLDNLQASHEEKLIVE